MKTAIALMLVLATASGNALAAVAPSAPEINPASAVGALTLLGGSILVLRARLKK